MGGILGALLAAPRGCRNVRAQQAAPLRGYQGPRYDCFAFANAAAKALLGAG